MITKWATACRCASRPIIWWCFHATRKTNGRLVGLRFANPTYGLATGSRVLSMFPSHHDHQVGNRVQVRLAADHLVVFPRKIGI